MSAMQVSEVSLDEMWKVMEDFGVKRDLVEKINPSREQVEEVYLLITQAKNNRKSNVDSP